MASAMASNSWAAFVRWSSCERLISRVLPRYLPFVDRGDLKSTRSRIAQYAIAYLAGIRRRDLISSPGRRHGSDFPPEA